VLFCACVCDHVQYLKTLELTFGMEGFLPVFAERIRFSAILTQSTLFKTINIQARRPAGSINCNIHFREILCYDMDYGVCIT
jgi:hypothetical protein